MLRALTGITKFKEQEKIKYFLEGGLMKCTPRYDSSQLFGIATGKIVKETNDALIYNCNKAENGCFQSQVISSRLIVSHLCKLDHLRSPACLQLGCQVVLLIPRQPCLAYHSSVYLRVPKSIKVKLFNPHFFANNDEQELYISPRILDAIRESDWGDACAAEGVQCHANTR